MNNPPGRSSAAAMVFVSLFTRLFWGMAVDHPFVGNGVWICPLLGLVFYLPFGFAVQMMASLGSDSPWRNLCKNHPPVLVHCFELAFALILLFDGALSMRLMANTANTLALSNTSIVLLIIPLSLLVLCIVRLGADTEGNNARLWMHMLPLLFLIMVLVQLRSYRPAWLAPVLGNGAGGIISGGIYCAGCMAVLTLPWMIAVPDRDQSRLFKHIACAALCSSALLIVMQMLSPPLIDMRLSRTSRVEKILANGRITLSLQMVMIVLWYGGLMHLLATEAVSAACFLSSVFPKVSLWGIAAVTGIAMTALAASAFAASDLFLRRLKWGFVIVGTLLIIALLAGLRRKEENICKKRSQS